MTTSMVLAALALAAGNPTSTSAEAAAPKANPPVPAASAPPEKPICRNVETTSTRLGRRKLCMSREAWQRHDRESEGATRGMDRDRG